MLAATAAMLAVVAFTPHSIEATPQVPTVSEATGMTEFAPLPFEITDAVGILREADAGASAYELRPTIAYLPDQEDAPAPTAVVLLHPEADRMAARVAPAT